MGERTTIVEGHGKEAFQRPARGFDPAAPARHRLARDSARTKLDMLRSRAQGLMEVLYSLRTFHSILAGRVGVFELEDFQSFAREPLARHAELHGLSFIPLIHDTDRAGLESAMSTRFGAPFEITELDDERALRRSGIREFYAPIVFVEPLERNTVALGFDLASDSSRRQALERARDTGEPCTTPLIRLVQEAGDQLGSLVLLPLYREPAHTVEERRKRLSGYVCAAFRIGDFVDSVLRAGGEESDSVEVSVFDMSPERKLIYRSHPAAQPGGGGEMLAEWLEFAGARWRVAARVGGAMAPPEQAAATDANYGGIFENAVVGIFQTTRGGRYLKANPAMARIYGYDSAEQLIAELSDIGRQLYVQPGRRKQFIRQLRRHDTISGFESQVRRRDGTIIWISEKARAVRDARGILICYEGIVEDITEKVGAAEALRQANAILETRVAERTSQLHEANSALQEEIAVRKRAEEKAERANVAKSMFLANMSHEIRTPLNAVLGYAQILARKDGLPEDAKSALHAITESSDHLLRLVEGILDLSKIEAGRIEMQAVDFDLSALLRSLDAIFRQPAEEKGLRLIVETPGRLPLWVHGDQGKLRQVLINLLGNAVKFTDQGEVRLRFIPEESGDAYRFEIIDDGPGLSAEFHAGIFEAFQQTLDGARRGGAGLGLPISRKLLAIMGSELELKSQPGWGSNFHFRIALPPLAGAMPTQAREGESRQRIAGGRAVHALVVDDHRVNRDILRQMLFEIGCRVKAAENGRQALELAGAPAPDIVFIDIRLPGMDGLQAVDELRAKAGATTPKMVCYSASAFEHEWNKYRDAGFDDFLPKPLSYERLRACLSGLLGVSFETASPAEESAGTISQATAGALARAAEIGDFATIREILGQLDEAGLSGLAHRLRGHAERFDTRGFEGALARVAVLDETEARP
jgi:PAS domain S-box-containing protein